MNLYALEHHVETKLAEARAAGARAAIAASLRADRRSFPWLASLLAAARTAGLARRAGVRGCERSFPTPAGS